MRTIDWTDFALRYRRKPISRFVKLLLICAGLGLFSLSSPAFAKVRQEMAPVPESKSADQTANLAEERFNEGVKAYRNGEYEQASKIFEVLHRQFLEKDKFTYYLAITQAQLGRFQQAKQLYEEIIALDPNGEPAALAKQGLQYLPPEASIDPPPRFNQMTTAPSLPDANRSAAPTYANPGQQANPSPSAPSGISPQDLMAWQMLMGQNNGSNNNNPMGMFMPGMMGYPNGMNGNTPVDPSIMSTMLMNQMMQNMNLSGEQGENR